MVLFSCMPWGGDMKTKDGSEACRQNAKNGPLHVSYSNYTSCKKKKENVRPYLFYFFLIFPSSNMCQVSLQSINSFQKFSLAVHHQLTFTFVFLHTLCKEKKRALEWGKFVWWVMRWKFLLVSLLAFCYVVLYIAVICSLICLVVFFVSFCFHWHK